MITLNAKCNTIKYGNEPQYIETCVTKVAAMAFCGHAKANGNDNNGNDNDNEKYVQPIPDDGLLCDIFLAGVLTRPCNIT